MDKILFGKRLRELRKNKNLTQEQLAELIGKEDKHISALERGLHFPTYPTLKKLSKALDVELNEMFFFLHYRDNNFLLEKNLEMIKNANDEQLKVIYHFLSAILA